MRNLFNSSDNGRKTLSVLLVCVAVLLVLCFLLQSCNSTKKIQNSTSQTKSKDSVSAYELLLLRSEDSASGTGEYKAHFSTGDSLLDNEMTIVFDSAYKVNADAVSGDSNKAPQEIIIAQQSGITTIDVGNRKLQSIHTKILSHNIAKSKEVTTLQTNLEVAKKDSGVSKGKDSVVQNRIVVSDVKKVQKKKLPFTEIICGFVGLVLIGIMIYAHRHTLVLTKVENKVEEKLRLNRQD